MFDGIFLWFYGESLLVTVERAPREESMSCGGLKDLIGISDIMLQRTGGEALNADQPAHGKGVHSYAPGKGGQNLPPLPSQFL